MTTPRPDHPRELISAFADGELDGDERREVELHVADCAECRALLDDLGTIASSIGALDVPPVPEGLEAAIAARLDAAGAPRARRKSRRRRRVPRRRIGPAAIALAASFAAVVVIGVVYRSVSSRQLVPGAPPNVEKEQVDEKTMDRLRSLGYVGNKSAPPSDEPLSSAPTAKPKGKPSPPAADALPKRDEHAAAGTSRDERAGNRPDAESPAFAPAPPLPSAPPDAGGGQGVASAQRVPMKSESADSAESKAAPRPQPMNRPTVPDAAAVSKSASGVADVAAANTIATIRPPAGHEDDLVVVLIGPDNGPRALWTTDAPDKARSRLATVVTQFGGAVGPAGPDGPGTMWVPRAKAAAFLDWLRRQGVTGLPDPAQLNAAGTTGIVRIEIR